MAASHRRKHLRACAEHHEYACVRLVSLCAAGRARNPGASRIRGITNPHVGPARSSVRLVSHHESACIRLVSLCAAGRARNPGVEAASGWSWYARSAPMVLEHVAMVRVVPRRLSSCTLRVRRSSRREGSCFAARRLPTSPWSQAQTRACACSLAAPKIVCNLFSRVIHDRDLTRGRGRTHHLRCHITLGGSIVSSFSYLCTQSRQASCSDADRACSQAFIYMQSTVSFCSVSCGADGNLSGPRCRRALRSARP